MTRRALIAAAIVALLDIAGTRRQRWADARCRRMATKRARNGWTERERRQMAAEPCVCVDGTWYSAGYFQGGVEG